MNAQQFQQAVSRFRYIREDRKADILALSGGMTPEERDVFLEQLQEADTSLQRAYEQGSLQLQKLRSCKRTARSLHHSDVEESERHAFYQEYDSSLPASSR